MYSFLICLAILIGGYFLYGKFVEKVFGPDDRITPAISMEDGVDYVTMPKWRIFLIQLLNIAGLGPIWGAVGGALWGPSVFLWITLGTVFAGAVHDFSSGFISIRNEGKGIAELCGIYMGKTIKLIMRIVLVVLMLMVGAVFAKGPAALLSYLFTQVGSGGGIFANASVWLVVIIIYYFIATFVPIDAIIGKIYPVFGFCLVSMALGVGIGIFANGSSANIPEIWNVIGTNMHPNGTGAWPMMFISVACGAISGFHATQSPMMARCCKSEKQTRQVFFGAMVCEGIIALVWAAASLAIFYKDGNLLGLQEAMGGGQASCVYNICETTMGKVGVVLAMLGVVACPITTGDTAFRCARLTVAEWFELDQKNWKKRFALAFPILAIGYLITQLDYNTVWSYFASINQMLSVIILWMAAIYLANEGKKPWIAVVPAMFMSAVTSTFAFSSSLYLGKIAFFSSIANYGGVVIAIVFLALFLSYCKKREKKLQ